MGTVDKKANSSSGFVYNNLSFGAKEAFKRLRTNVVCAFNDEKSKVIGITSSQPSEGKSLIAINFACSLAELGKNVVIVDTDLFRPSIFNKLGLENDIGLTDIVAQKIDAPSAIKKYGDDASQISISVITSGSDCNNPSEFLNSKRLSQFISSLKSRYDYVIIDMPPVGSVADVAPLTKRTDGVLVVVRERHCPKRLLSSCMEQLQMVGTNVLGFVLNGSLDGTSKKYYKSYNSYGYGYGYYGDKKSK